MKETELFLPHSPLGSLEEGGSPNEGKLLGECEGKIECWLQLQGGLQFLVSWICCPHHTRIPTMSSLTLVSIAFYCDQPGRNEDVPKTNLCLSI